ncbi:MAG: T9SS type A sorting domain-containing protein [Flavobacteriales bacterium]|nr:T9SS type A sorting domain-containing protein [Flavobacteriales bacterium]
MNRKTTIILGLATAFMCFQAFAPKTTGSHPSSTGAPGENTCARSGCHANANVNAGDGVNSYTFKNSVGTDVSNYDADETYSISVKIAESSTSKFGFEIVALDVNDDNIGSWIITDAVRTWHQQTSDPSSLNRKYVTHESAGTTATYPGESMWEFDWEAPVSGTGDVTFYFCTSATNNDGSGSGETLYLSNFTIPETGTTTGIIAVVDGEKLIKISYQQKEGLIQTEFSAKSGDNVLVKLSDLNGKQVAYVASIARNNGKTQQSLFVPGGISSGVYLVTVFVNNQASTKKIFIPKTN